MDSVSQSNINSSLSYLAGAALEGRLAGSSGDLLARAYIKNAFEAAGLLPPFGNSYYQPFDAGLGDTANVVGIFPGSDAALMNQAIVIGAHYDHLGIVNGNIIYGAHDNASGVSALLEVARALSPLRNYLKRSIVFAAFDAEEEYMLGSHYYSQNPVLPPLSNTIYMTNIDQDGYANVNGLIGSCVTTSSRVRTRFLQIASRYPSVAPVQDGPCWDNSDDLPFRSHGIPTIYFTTGFAGTPYHTTYDTADRIDYRGLTDITKIALELIWQTAQDSNRP